MHLRLPPGPHARTAHVKANTEDYAGLLGRACPAAVYEYVDDDGPDGLEANGGYNGKKLVINSQVGELFNLSRLRLYDERVSAELHSL